MKKVAALLVLLVSARGPGRLREQQFTPDHDDVHRQHVRQRRRRRAAPAKKTACAKGGSDPEGRSQTRTASSPT